MGNRIVRSRFSDSSVSAFAFAPLKFFEGAVEPHEEDVVGLQQEQEAVHPYPLFNDVLDDQVVSCECQCGDAPMEAFKEALPHGRPRELAALDSVVWKHTTCFEVVY